MMPFDERSDSARRYFRPGNWSSRSFTRRRKIGQIALAPGGFLIIVSAQRCRREAKQRMQEITCPNCNVDVEQEELRRNNLRCPTCGFDLSDTEDKEDLASEKDEFDDEEDEDEEEEDDEDDEDEEE